MDDRTTTAGTLPFAKGRILVVALRGWNDAGEAASSAVTRLAEALGLTESAELIDDEDFFDYSINRPHTGRGEDGARRILWPSCRIDRRPVASDAAETGDEIPLDFGPANLADDAQLHVTGDNGASVLVMTGPEPTLRWRAFAERVLEVAVREGVTHLFLVGALLADVPHSRPVNVFVSSDDERLREELEASTSHYEGPTGVLGVLSGFSADYRIPAVSLWASVPHYTSAPPSPKVELAILDKLEELLDVSIPRAELIERSETWEREVDDATRDDNEVIEYIEYLERAHDTVESPEASGEAIAKEFERFLSNESRRGRASGVAGTQGPWAAPTTKPHDEVHEGDEAAGGAAPTDEPDDGAPSKH